MPSTTTRAEHLQWAKDRALAYLNPPELVATEVEGLRAPSYTRITADGQRHTSWPPAVSPQQVADALASFLSDLGKHPETMSHPALMLVGFEMLGGGLKTADQVRHFIDSTN